MIRAGARSGTAAALSMRCLRPPAPVPEMGPLFGHRLIPGLLPLFTQHLLIVRLLLSSTGCSMGGQADKKCSVGRCCALRQGRCKCGVGKTRRRGEATGAVGGTKSNRCAPLYGQARNWVGQPGGAGGARPLARSGLGAAGQFSSHASHAKIRSTQGRAVLGAAGVAAPGRAGRAAGEPGGQVGRPYGRLRR